MTSKIILLVDDSKDDIFLTRRALKKANILNEVKIISDGIEAMDYLFGTGKYSGRDLSQMPVVMLLDLNMPGISGLQVLRKVRENPLTRLLPVVVLTASKEESDIVESYKMGANAYVRKPVDFDRFCEAIRQIGMFWLGVNEPPYHLT